MLKKNLVRILSVLILMTILIFIQRLVVPKYMDDIVEGTLIETYYDEEKDHDVVFIGDCEVYENFSPITLWEDYGIKSFIRGSAQQLIWQSYYLMEETLKYEKPEVIVFNVLSMKYNEPQNEAYNRMTLDGMKLSMSKLKSIEASMMEDEKFIDYIFPILRFHSRWNTLESQDFKYFFSKEKIFHNGYYMRVDTKPVESFPRKKPLADYQLGENAYHYLQKMTELAKEHDIELVLIKAPTIYPVWYDEWDQQIEDYAKEHNLMYLNFLELTEEANIDFSKHTYDAGLHLNLQGAENLSKYFGKILVDHYELTDHRSNDATVQVWEEKSKFYYTMEEEQYFDLNKYGYLKNFGAKKPENN
jgi:hypothetical protein